MTYSNFGSHVVEYVVLAGLLGVSYAGVQAIRQVVYERPPVSYASSGVDVRKISDAGHIDEIVDE
jgi:hypothetical protein